MRLTTTTIAVASADDNHGTVPCGFDAEGTAHLMRLLSDLYSNAHAAVLREYSVNAYDSHRQSGNPAPIEVTLPTDLNPTLIITDHGTGLSRDEVTCVYARYGASTKRGSDDLVGAFGLGTKSAFTLGQQFIVTAVKDGWRTVAAFGIGESGTGTVTILSHHQVADADGVTVSISVDSPDEVHRAAGAVFCTWQPGTVLVNGQRPWSVLDAPLAITDSIYLADSPEGDAGTWGDAGLIVVMGNIGYPVSPGLRDKLRRRIDANNTTPPVWTLLHAQRSSQRVFAYVDIGAVDIAPSREEMRDTPRTMDRLARIVDEYLKGICRAVQREVGSAPTLTAAARQAAALSRRPHLAHAAGRSAGLSWHGQLLDHQVRVPYPASEFDPDRRRCQHDRESILLDRNDPALDSTLIITDVPEDKREVALRAARAFLAKRADCRRVIFTSPGAKPAGWFVFGEPDTFPAMPFTVYLGEARGEPTASAAGRLPAQAIRYTTIAGPDGSSRELTAEEIAALRLPVVVADSRSDELCAGPLRFEAFARAVREGTALVKLSGGRTPSALQRRLGPGVPLMSLAERASAVAADVAATVTDDDQELERARACTAQIATQIAGHVAALRGRVTGPAAEVLDRLHRAGQLTADETARLHMIAGAREQQPALFPPAVQRANLFDLFPLLAFVPSYRMTDPTTRDHMVAYLNAITG